MDKLEYKGEIYVRRRDKWTDSRNMVVSEGMQKELNAEFVRQLDMGALSVDECVQYGDRFKGGGSNGLALRFYEAASENADFKTMSYILPRMASCYRKIGQPQKAIDIMSYASDTFGSTMITPALLTSAGAAYCDLEDYKRARKCCDRALAALNGNSSEELSLVYKRIEKETKLKQPS